eukprot:jgi/Mesen1/6049/ME000308S05246
MPGVQPAASPPLAGDVLEAEKARLENAVKHLVRSNEELQAALAAGDSDPEYERAIQENQEVIQAMREKIALLEAEIAEARRERLEADVDMDVGEGDGSPAPAAESSGGNTSQQAQQNGGASSTQDGWL